MYTENFSEAHAVLVHQIGAAVTTEQNTAFVDMSKYHRLAICVHAMIVGTTLDMDVEIATDSDGTGLFTLKSATQLVAADDDDFVIFEIRSEELGHPTGASSENYDFVRLELTPSGAATFSVVIYGIEPRYAPVTLTLVDEVVD